MSYYAACVQLAVDDSEIAAATLAENMTFDAVQVSREDILLHHNIIMNSQIPTLVTHTQKK